LERFGVIVPALAATDPLRLQLDPPAVIAAGQAIMAGLVDCLPAPDGGSGADGGSLTGRLWGKLCPAPPDDGLKGALRAALVLLADHELAASTFAARVAASVRAEHRLRAGGPGQRGRHGSGAAEAVFAVARTAGWIGHALEEYARHTPLRPRARYTGPRYPAPGGNQQGTPRFDGG